MSGRKLEMYRRTIPNPQCRRIMLLQHEARDLHFFISHAKHSRVYYISTFSTFIIYHNYFHEYQLIQSNAPTLASLFILIPSIIDAPHNKHIKTANIQLDVYSDSDE